MGTARIYYLTDANDAGSPSRKADRLLVKQAVAGDRRAFQQIVEQNKRRMLSVARGVLRSPHMVDDAEDVVQEAFIKAYRALPDFRGDACLSTWLYRITYLAAIDHQRQQRRHRQLAEAVDAVVRSDTDATTASITGGSSNEIESGQLGREIDAALGKLTKFEQTIFALRHMRNFKLREIAVVVDRSEGTVKNILFRAIRKLRDHLQDSEDLLEEIRRC